VPYTDFLHTDAFSFRPYDRNTLSARGQSARCASRTVSTELVIGIAGIRAPRSEEEPAILEISATEADPGYFLLPAFRAIVVTSPFCLGNGVSLEP
jgi:hypothetical protein